MFRAEETGFKAMMKLLLLLLPVFCCLARKHSMTVFFTASSGFPNLPAITMTILIDGTVTGYCDDVLQTAVPKQAWMEDLIKEDAHYWSWYKQECVAHLQYFNAEFLGLKKRLNKTGDRHILQKLTSCEWDEDTGDVNAIHQYGFDGEDFIVLDLDTETWIALKPQAVVLKHLWDADRRRTDFWVHFLKWGCAECVKKNLQYGRSALLRTDLPSVALLQTAPWALVTCHATGFYPSRATMLWRKDSQAVEVGVERGEVLPNHDGTFQMSIQLNVSSLPAEDWGRYECVFQLPGPQNVIVTRLDRSTIRTNWVPKRRQFSLIFHVSSTGCFLLFVCTGALFTCRKKLTGLFLKNVSEPETVSLQSPSSSPSSPSSSSSSSSSLSSNAVETGT